MKNLDLNKLKETINQRLPKNGKLIYLTLAGSHLFGLNTEKSDIDIKGIFLPSTIDSYSEKPEHLDLSTNKTNTKNNLNDIDIELFSLKKFFKMLEKGDTNSYDMIFSMFQSNNILYETKESRIIKKNYRDFLSTNSKAFLGYVVAQTKKYGVKGERYKSLKQVYSFLLEYIKKNNVDLMNENISEFIQELLKENFNHVVLLDKTDKETRVGGGVYIQILNKEYHETIKFYWFLEKLENRLKQYGERSKKASEGVDFKSLSHALRIILEFEELMKSHFIKFPLKEKEKILKVKKGDLSDFDNDYKKILLYLDNKVNEIEKLVKEAGLPDKINEAFFNKTLIEILSTVEN